jgi:catechol 2,3-dioxygenase-like lactoylglutathione lyase family enzyme
MLNAVDTLVTIGAVNLECLVAFYSDLLGKSPVKHSPGVYAEFHFPALKLGLFAPKSPGLLQPARPPSMGMALCFEVADLKAAIAHLTALGYRPPGSIIHAAHGQEIYAYDPEGNGLILHQSAN